MGYGLGGFFKRIKEGRRKGSFGSVFIEFAITLPFYLLLLTAGINISAYVHVLKRLDGAGDSAAKTAALLYAGDNTITDAAAEAKCEEKAEDFLDGNCLNCSGITATATVVNFNVTNPANAKAMEIDISVTYSAMFLPIPGLETVTISHTALGYFKP